MAKWAGEGNDWINLVAQHQPRKEDVIHSSLASMRQAVEKKTKANGTRPTKKPSEVLPLELIPEEGKKLTPEIDVLRVARFVNNVDALDAHVLFSSTATYLSGATVCGTDTLLGIFGAVMASH